MDLLRSSFSKFLSYWISYKKYIIFFGLVANLTWAFSLVLNLTWLKFLGIFFDWKSINILADVFLNILTFNWVFISCKFVFFWSDLFSIMTKSVGFKTPMGVFTCWYYSFGNLGTIWSNLEPKSSGLFFSQMHLKTEILCFETVKFYASFLCPHYFFSKISDYFKNISFNKLTAIFMSNVKNVLGLLSVNFFFITSFLMFFISTISSFFLLSYLGIYGVFVLNAFTIVLFWVMTVSMMHYFFYNSGKLFISFGKWFSLHGYSIIEFEFYLDSLSYSYVLLTLTIALAVFFYTFSYFRYEPNVERLLLLINLFVISMLIFVSSANVFILFLGWECIGITSFLLIGFWSTKISALKSAFKAVAFNKFSDVSLFIAILTLYLVCGSQNIFFINSVILTEQKQVISFASFDISFIEFVSFFILSAAFIKSAQFGVHIWLPDSMDAPVPASALIHSATLVSAGVFLFLRFSPIFSLSIYTDSLLLLIGSFTAFFGAWVACYQTDLKRILAYSTMSHCGFLMVTCFLKNPELSIFYLYVHGFFKASIFLCVGNIIRFASNYQDVRRMGDFWKYLPFEAIVSLICLVNLAGLPFTLGFNMKHMFLSSLNYNSWLLMFSLFFIIVGLLAGFVYSYKIYYYVFLDFKKSKKFIYKHTNTTNLKSDHYSNTTLASMLSITFLVLVGYFICLYNFSNWTALFSTYENLDFIYHELGNNNNLNWSLSAFLSFLSFINWFSILLILVLVASNWRFNVFSNDLYNNFFIGFLFIFLLFINLLILC